MPIERNELISYINDYLNINAMKDYCPNGLQVEGADVISKIVTGVTASQALIDSAIKQDADLLIVHHGYFWKGESQPIVGLKMNRIRALLTNDLNLAAYHLPIDCHVDVGNNVQLGQLLGFSNIEPIACIDPVGVLYKGTLAQPLSATELGNLVGQTLQRTPLVEQVSDNKITTVAWCTGGGQGYIDSVAELGIDAFITGEVSEQTIHSAREHRIHFIAAGHHATERYGVKALGEHIQERFDVDVTFIDIDNPA